MSFEKKDVTGSEPGETDFVRREKSAPPPPPSSRLPVSFTWLPTDVRCPGGGGKRLIPGGRGF